jgi:outer membrane autotransporter protein
LAGLGFAALTVAHAQDATWTGANSGDWTDPGNWSPNQVPGGIATFTSPAAATTVDNNNGVVFVGAINFTAAPNALAYTFNVESNFIVNGAGVTNSSTNTQTFNVVASSGASLVFNGSATANNGTGAVVYNNDFFIEFDNTSNAGNVHTTFNNNTEIIQFFDSSNAGSATFNNHTAQLNFFISSSAANATIVNDAGGFVSFNNTSTAGSATITNNASGPTLGDLEFNDSSTAGSAIITNNGMINFNTSATAGGASITNNAGATIDFNNAASGGAATFTNNTGGAITFHDTSTAGTTASYASSGTASVTFNDSSTAGSASFTQNGTSTLVFNNSSSAATATITNNTGTVTFNNTSTAGAANITNNNQLTFNNTATAGSATIGNSGTMTFNNGADAGSAGITNNLSGVLTFNQTASANTAAIANSGNLNFTGASTAASATLTTNSGGFTAFAGASSGGSARFINNAGGTVDISNLTTAGMTAGSIEGAGNYFLGGKALTVGSLNTSTTVSGIVTDGGVGGGIGGQLDKVGTGTLTLANTNLYTGATTVDGGTLSVTGSIALSSGVTINAGATLNGTGTVSAIQVNSGGTLMPGLPAAVGTLQATSVTFASGASYLITINGVTNSKVNAGGSATLNSGATVNIAAGSTINPNQTYTILTAGLVTGQFNPNATFGAFRGTLSYDANDVFLTFSFANLAPLLPPGAPQNVVNVATAIDGFTDRGGTLPPGFSNLAMLSQAQLTNALTQLSGELGTGAQLSAFQLMNEFMSLLLDPLADGHGGGIGPLPFAPAGPQQTTFTPEVANAYASVLKAPAAPITAYGPWRAWGTAFGGANNIAGDPVAVGSHDVRTTAGGFAAGLDYRVSPATVLGVAFAGAATGWNLSAGLGSGNSDAFQAGLYAKHQFDAAYVAGALAFANYWASTSRSVTVAGTDTLKASFDAQSFGGRLEGGYRVSLAPFALTPYAALQAQSFRLPGYSETAASGSPQFALSYAGQASAAERAEFGAWLSRSLLLGSDSTLSLFGRAAWAHDWFRNLAVTPSFQALPGASFVVNGAAPPHDIALVTAGAEWRLRSNWSLMGRFDGEFGDGQQTYTGTARLRYAW